MVKYLICIACVIFITLTGKLSYCEDYGYTPERFYANSIFSFQLMGGVGTAWGEIIDKEFDSFVLNYEWDDGDTEASRPNHTYWLLGAFADVTPFHRKTSAGSPVVLGLRLGITANYINQDTSVGNNSFLEELLKAFFEDEDDYDDDYELDQDKHEVVSYGGMLLRYKALTAGPVLKYFPDSSTNICIELYFLYGKIFDGVLTAFPSKRDYGTTFDESEYVTKVRGEQIILGTAVSTGHFSIGISYIYTGLKLDNRLPVYGGEIGEKTSVHTILLSITGGLYF